MTDAIGAQDVRARALAQIQRASVEAKLSGAINRARNDYLKNEITTVKQKSVPTQGPSYLGRNVDIKA